MNNLRTVNPIHRKIYQREILNRPKESAAKAHKRVDFSSSLFWVKKDKNVDKESAQPRRDHYINHKDVNCYAHWMVRTGLPLAGRSYTLTSFKAAVTPPIRNRVPTYSFHSLFSDDFLREVAFAMKLQVGTGNQNDLKFFNSEGEHFILGKIASKVEGLFANWAQMSSLTDLSPIIGENQEFTSPFALELMQRLNLKVYVAPDLLNLLYASLLDRTNHEAYSTAWGKIISGGGDIWVEGRDSSKLAAKEERKPRSFVEQFV